MNTYISNKSERQEVVKFIDQELSKIKKAMYLGSVLMPLGILGMMFLHSSSGELLNQTNVLMLVMVSGCILISNKAGFYLLKKAYENKTWIPKIIIEKNNVTCFFEPLYENETSLGGSETIGGDRTHREENIKQTVFDAKNITVRKTLDGYKLMEHHRVLGTISEKMARAISKQIKINKS